MSKSPYTPEFRAKVAQEYIEGLGSFSFIANYYCIDEKTVREWVAKYKLYLWKKQAQHLLLMSVVRRPF